MTAQKIVVFGSSGQGGRVIVQHLRERYEVVGFDRSDGFDVLDARRHAEMVKACRGAAAVIHVAVNPTPSYRTHEELPTRAQDIAITCAIVQACIDAGGPPLIYGSSIGLDPAFGRMDGNYYAMAKRFGEDIVRTYAERSKTVAISLRFGGFGNPHLPPPPPEYAVSEDGTRRWIDHALRHCALKSSGAYYCLKATDHELRQTTAEAAARTAAIQDEAAARAKATRVDTIKKLN